MLKNIFIPPGVFLRALQDPGNSLQLKTRHWAQNRKKPVILDKKLKKVNKTDNKNRIDDIIKYFFFASKSIF